MTRTRNAKGQLEDYGHRAIELPQEADTPVGWVRADGTHAYEPSAATTFDDAGRPSTELQPLSGRAAIGTILRFFNLSALERRGQIDRKNDFERRQLQMQLQDPRPRGLRDWMRLPVDVEVRVGPHEVPGRMTDIGAGGIRVEGVTGRFMVGSRMAVTMQYAFAEHRGTLTFATRVAWSNDIRRTLGLEFTAAPTWHGG